MYKLRAKFTVALAHSPASKCRLGRVKADTSTVADRALYESGGHSSAVGALVQNCSSFFLMIFTALILIIALFGVVQAVDEDRRLPGSFLPYVLVLTMAQ